MPYSLNIVNTSKVFLNWNIFRKRNALLPLLFTFFFFPILTCKTYISHAFKAISISWKSSWWVQCWERHIKTSFISETVKIVFTYTTLHWVRDHLLQLLWLLDACIFFFRESRETNYVALQSRRCTFKSLHHFCVVLKQTIVSKKIL